jgi:hypothetical protein
MEDMQALSTGVAVGGGEGGDVSEEAAVLREMVAMLQEENESLRGGSGGSVQATVDAAVAAAVQVPALHNTRRAKASDAFGGSRIALGVDHVELFQAPHQRLHLRDCVARSSGIVC